MASLLLSFLCVVIKKTRWGGTEDGAELRSGTDPVADGNPFRRPSGHHSSVPTHYTHMSRRPLIAAEEQAVTKAATYPMNMSVQLKHTVVYPGNILAGWVTIKPAVPTPVGSCDVKITCKEQVYESGHLHTLIHYKQILLIVGSPGGAANCFQQVRGNVPVPPDAFWVQPGVFQYPFAFQLPESLPATLSSPCGTQTVELICKVRAKFIALGDKLSQTATAYFDVVKGCPRAKHDSLVAQPRFVQMDPSAQLLACCCLSRGYISGSLMFKPLVVLDQENTLRVDVTVDLSRAEANVSQLSVELEHVFWCSSPHLRREVSRRLLSSGTPEQKLLPKGTVHSKAFEFPLDRKWVPTQTSYAIISQYRVRLSVGIDSFLPNGPFSIEGELIVASVLDESGYTAEVEQRLASAPPPQPVAVRKDHVVTYRNPETIFHYSYAPPVQNEIACRPFGSQMEATTAAVVAVPGPPVLGGGQEQGAGREVPLDSLLVGQELSELPAEDQPMQRATTLNLADPSTFTNRAAFSAFPDRSWDQQYSLMAVEAAGGEEEVRQALASVEIPQQWEIEDVEMS